MQLRVAASVLGAAAALYVLYRRRRVRLLEAAAEQRQPQQVVFADGVERSVEDERRYRHITLPSSGISILLCSDARAEKRAAAAMCVEGAGARTAPKELVGLAHYLEHMLFLGSKKYLSESHYKKVVALHNGRCNASTAPEKTVYHFEVDATGLEDVLDIFAQFFVGEPLLDEGAAERELNAVTAEDARNRINDDRRKRMVVQHTVPDKRVGTHTWAKFGTGNKDTLGPAAAAAAGGAVRPALLAYRERFYRLDHMSLALVSAASLDELEALARKIFGPAYSPDGGAILPTVMDTGGGVLAGGAAAAPEPEEARAARAAANLVNEAADLAASAEAGVAHPWADAGLWPFELRIAPITERRCVSLMWPMPPSASQHRHPCSPAARYLSYVLGHEGEGSLFAALQRLGLATHVSAGSYIDDADVYMLLVKVSLTTEGEAQLRSVLTLVYAAVGVLRRADEADACRVWRELCHVARLGFVYAERGDAYSETADWARRLYTYGGRHVLTGGRVLDGETFPAAAVREALGTYVVPANCMVVRESTAFKAGLAATMGEGEDDDEGDSVSVGAPVGVTFPPTGDTPSFDELFLETYYQIPYERRAVPGELLEALRLATEGQYTVTDATGVTSAGPLMHLPESNPFLTSDFRMVGALSTASPGVPPLLPAPPLVPAPPRQLLRAQESRVVHWHQTELSFGKPKAHVVVSLCITTGLLHSVHLDLLLAILEQRLAVALYPAYLAGLRWSFGHGPRALTLSAQGFSERLPALVSTLLRELLRWDPTETARLFEAKRELQTRQLRSHSKRRADELAYYFLGLLLRPRRRPVEESLATLESTGLEELRRVHEQTVGTKLATRALTYGNLDEARAAHLADEIERAIHATGAAPLPRDEWVFTPVVTLGAGARWRLRLPPQSKEENNSAVVHYVQLGQLRGSARHAQLTLLLRLLKQPLFDALRTKQQLGYVVASSAFDQHVGRDEVHGLVVQVLSRSYAPPAVQRAVDAYLRGFPQVVRALTAAEFDTSRQALVTRLLEPQRTLAEAFHHQWAPIDEEHLEWDAKVRLAGLVGLVTQAEVAELADEIGLEDSPLPKLSVHIFGNPHVHALDEDDGTGAAPIEDVEAWRQAQPTFARRR